MDMYYADGGAMARDPNNSLVFYSGGGYLNGTVTVMAVSKTTNGGLSWTRSLVTATTGFTYSLLVEPTNSNIVYAGGNPGLYKSTDGGVNWASSSAGITGTVYALARDPTSANILYAGTPSGVFKTTNAGASWSSTGSSNVKALVVNPNSATDVYAGTSSGVYRSTTGGGNWTAMNQGLLDVNVTCLGINPGSYLFAGTSSAGVHRWLFTGVAEDTGKAINPTFRIVPNPARGMTCITYSVETRGPVRLAVYDAGGRVVRTLVRSTLEPDTYTAVWSGLDDTGRPVPAGVYFYRLTTGKTKLTEKLILVK